jgi:hypothetical protein
VVCRADRSSHPCIAIDATVARGRMSPPRGEPSSDAAPFGRYPRRRLLLRSVPCAAHLLPSVVRRRCMLLEATARLVQQYSSCSNIHSQVTLLAKHVYFPTSFGQWRLLDRSVGSREPAKLALYSAKNWCSYMATDGDTRAVFSCRIRRPDLARTVVIRLYLVKIVQTLTN